LTDTRGRNTLVSMMSTDKPQYDAIVVGSGAAGGTLARELALRGQNVLVLEKGNGEPSPDSKVQPRGKMQMVFIGRFVPVVRGISVGGSTMLFYQTMWQPPLEYFRSLGIELAAEVEEVRKELPIAPLADELIGPVASRIMQSARELGYDWKKLDKAIFQERCQPGHYPYRARWTARYYLQEAVTHGAQVLAQADVRSVLFEGKRVRGVEFVHGGSRREALAPRVIVSAGGIGSPQLLQASGLSSIGKGFFCDPLITVFGTAEGVKNVGEFQMTAGIHLEDEGYMMTDLAFPEETYRIMAATALRFDRLFARSSTLSIMIKIRDEIAGHVRARKMRRIFGPPEREKLASGYRRAREILRHAGAKRIWKSRVVASHPGGTVRIGEHIDANLQTEYEGLYVCDCSVIADPWGLPPTLSLLSLAKRLAKHLA
jgi:choline dehydrogenase-like flavoprotein